MPTNKKNQHYLPKFYLRNFSFEGNNRQIGIFNLNNEYYYSTAKLKTQASFNFFYGYDGEIEEVLSHVESELSNLIRDILRNKTLPEKNSDKHISILTFIALTDLRNPIAIKGIQNSKLALAKRLHQFSPESDINELVPEIAHEEAVIIALSALETVIDNTRDLKYKLLVNKTNVPFITSDFPIVKYNQFLEEKRWKHGKMGYGNNGLQIYVPLSDKISLFLYDDITYKVGFKRDNFLNLVNIEDVDQFNLLQLLNCFNSVYFNEQIGEHYIKMLFLKSKKYRRANKTISSIHKAVVGGKEKGNIVSIGMTECEIGLKIQGIKKSSRALGVKIGPTLAQLRKRPYELMTKKYTPY